MRRIIYLLAVFGCLIFYTAYQEWLAYIVLLVLLALPWFSLLISLPAMLTLRITLHGADVVQTGTPAKVAMRGECPLPTPPFKARLFLSRPITGEQFWHKTKHDLPTEHCGALYVCVRRAWVYDYLGLIALPVRKRQEKTILVRPMAVEMDTPSDLRRTLAHAWKPKPGGGYSENYELRLYRPGDSLNQVHWKLTAKTGELILREPMQPDVQTITLTLDIAGDAATLDEVFGKLLNLGGYLLEQNLPFEIRAMTADGVQSHAASTPDDLTRAVDALLCCRPTDGATLRTAASRQYYIGGEPHEA